jgi:hypothetical protein
MKKIAVVSPTPAATWTRRSFLGAVAAGTAGLLGCAGPATPIPATMAVPNAAPRAGDTWRYQYTSGWRQDPPRLFTVRALEVTPALVRDELTAEAIAGARVDEFTSALLFHWRSLGAGFAVMELAPYLQAFINLAPGQTWYGIPMPVGAAPLTPWYARAQVQGPETITTPGGSMQTVRVNLSASRTGPGVSPSADVAQMQGAVWYSPQVKRVARFDYFTWTLAMNPVDRQSYQLVEYRPA